MGTEVERRSAIELESTGKGLVTTVKGPLGVVEYDSAARLRQMRYPDDAARPTKRKPR
jgi:hypothetical protein